MTPKEKREAQKRYNEIAEEFRAMADTLEKEKRGYTADEQKHVDELRAEQDRISARLRSEKLTEILTPAQSAAQRLAEAERAIRENVKRGVSTTIRLVREDPPVVPAEPTVTDINVANAGNIVRINLQDVLMPLQEGLILDKVGLPLMSGLVGEYVWPVASMVEATIGGDNMELTEQKISLSALKAVPDTIGVTCGVTRRTINQSGGIIETIVKNLLPMAVAKALNKAMFGTTAATGATNLVGPFIGKTPTMIAKTYADINKLKAVVLKSGVEGEHMAWVMTKSTKAILEATSKDTGSGIMICENDMIAGIPVFTTEFIGDDYIGIGDFTYQPVGQFGDFSFIVDPYTEARKDVVQFTLHVDFGTKTLRSDAFVLGKFKA